MAQHLRAARADGVGLTAGRADASQGRQNAHDRARVARRAVGQSRYSSPVRAPRATDRHSTARRPARASSGKTASVPRPRGRPSGRHSAIDRETQVHAGWSTRAQTLPPNPAPNADAAHAPCSRAVRASVTVSGTWLRSRSSASCCDRATVSAESVEVAPRQLVGGGRHEPGAFLEELFETVDELSVRPQQRAQALGSVARRRRSRRRARSPRRPVPVRQRSSTRAAMPRRAIVVVARLPGLARGHAADADRKDQPRGEGNRPLVARGAERVLRHAPWVCCTGWPCDPRSRPRCRLRSRPRARGTSGRSRSSRRTRPGPRALVVADSRPTARFRRGDWRGRARGGPPPSGRSNCSSRRPTAGRSRTPHRRRGSSPGSSGKPPQHGQRVGRPARLRPRSVHVEHERDPAAEVGQRETPVRARRGDHMRTRARQRR